MGRATTTVADLLAALEALDAEAFDRAMDALAGSAKLAASGWRMRERRLSQVRYRERNREIRLRHRDGASYGSLAIDYDISRSTIARICQRGQHQFSVRASSARTAISR